MHEQYEGGRMGRLDEFCNVYHDAVNRREEQMMHQEKYQNIPVRCTIRMVRTEKPVTGGFFAAVHHV